MTLRERIALRAYYLTLNEGLDHLTAWLEAEATETARDEAVEDLVADVEFARRAYERDAAEARRSRILAEIKAQDERRASATRIAAEAAAATAERKARAAAKGRETRARNKAMREADAAVSAQRDAEHEARRDEEAAACAEAEREARKPGLADRVQALGHYKLSPKVRSALDDIETLHLRNNGR